MLTHTALSPGRVYAAFPAPAPVERGHEELRSLVGPGAEFITTKHFVVAYDTPLETVRALTARLEATYLSVEKFCTFNGLGFEPPPGLLEILLFDQPQSFYRYAATLGVQAHGLNGFYHTGTDRSAFFNILNHPSLEELRREIGGLEKQVAQFNGRKLGPAERAPKEAALKQWHFYRNRRDQIVEKLNRSVVQHEVTHHLLFEAGVHVKGVQNPGWLVEGLATLFETPPSAKGSGLGVTNQMRLADFRAACGETLGAQDQRPRKLKPEALQNAYTVGRFVPLRQLLTLSDLAADPNEPNIGYLYAQAWGLAFYLQREHRAKLAEYVAMLAQRRPGQEVTPEEELAQFETVFGPVDERFERRWAGFVFNLPFTPEFGER